MYVPILNNLRLQQTVGLVEQYDVHFSKQYNTCIQTVFSILYESSGFPLQRDPLHNLLIIISEICGICYNCWY
jgi:hypothetical protein